MHRNFFLHSLYGCTDLYSPYSCMKIHIVHTVVQKSVWLIQYRFRTVVRNFVQAVQKEGRKKNFADFLWTENVVFMRWKWHANRENYTCINAENLCCNIFLKSSIKESSWTGFPLWGFFQGLGPKFSVILCGTIWLSIFSSLGHFISLGSSYSFTLGTL